MVLTLVTPPATRPVSLVEAKDHLRVLEDDYDTRISGLILAATQHLDGSTGVLGRALLEQTWRLDCERPCNRRVPLPLPPVSEVVSVKYLVDGVEQTLAAEAYRLGRNPLGWLVALNDGYDWPTMDCREDALRVTFTTGEAAAPEPIRQAILLLVEHLFEGGRAEDLPPAAAALLSPYRVRRL